MNFDWHYAAPLSLCSSMPACYAEGSLVPLHDSRFNIQDCHLRWNLLLRSCSLLLTAYFLVLIAYSLLLGA
jgi:hypothetical protein